MDAENHRCLGLIGGLGVGATVYYYQELAKAHAAASEPMRLLIAHADINRVLGHMRDAAPRELAAYFAEMIAGLAAAGATVAAISSVTPHVCLPELTRQSALPLISIVDPTAREIRSRGLRRVALFGSRFVVESGLFGMLDGVEVVTPRPDEIDFIHRTYFDIVHAGQGAERERAALTAVANTLRERDGVEAIVLAGTELALVFGEGAPFPAVDCTRLHLDELLRQMGAPASS